MGPKIYRRRVPEVMYTRNPSVGKGEDRGDSFNLFDDWIVEVSPQLPP